MQSLYFMQLHTRCKCNRGLIAPMQGGGGARGARDRRGRQRVPDCRGAGGAGGRAPRRSGSLGPCTPLSALLGAYSHHKHSICGMLAADMLLSITESQHRLDPEAAHVKQHAGF